MTDDLAARPAATPSLSRSSPRRSRPGTARPCPSTSASCCWPGWPGSTTPGGPSCGPRRRSARASTTGSSPIPWPSRRPSWPRPCAPRSTTGSSFAGPTRMAARASPSVTPCCGTRSTASSSRASAPRCTPPMPPPSSDARRTIPPPSGPPSWPITGMPPDSRPGRCPLTSSRAGTRPGCSRSPRRASTIERALALWAQVDDPEAVSGVTLSDALEEPRTRRPTRATTRRPSCASRRRWRPSTPRPSRPGRGDCARSSAGCSGGGDAEAAAAAVAEALRLIRPNRRRTPGTRPGARGRPGDDGRPSRRALAGSREAIRVARAASALPEEAIAWGVQGWAVGDPG